ncbi:MAG: ABC transporter substrate-binding protein [Chloroflexota bacterium]
MSRRSARVASVLGVSAILVTAFGGAGSAQSPSAAPYPSPVVTPEMPAPDITSYPNYGDGVDCANGTFNGLPYSGNLKSIDAPDEKTVVFSFCNPDVAFLSQIAFNPLAIDDSAYLIAHMPDKSILRAPNGTGPFKLTNWESGSRIDFEANPDYWGTAPLSPQLELQWADQSAARLLALQSDSGIDGIDNPGKDDLPAIESDSNLKFYPRQGLNTFYLGFNNTIAPFDNVKVRQAIAMGIDRQRIVDNFLPPGSEVAPFFTPCAIPLACGGDAYYDFDPVAAKALLAEAGFPDGFETTLSFRDADRSYISGQPVVAQDIADQLKTNLGITVNLDLEESGTFLANAAGGKLPFYMLGWGADYPDASNFLGYHFGSGIRFGNLSQELMDAANKGGQSADDAERLAEYTKVNNLVKEQLPAFFISHAGSGTAFKADVEGGFASPLLERFDKTKAADRGILVFMQNKEPLSLYCGDETDGETLRACNQIKESLYAFGGESGLEPVPALATSCTPNADLTQWTCTLRDGVKFQDGSTFEASDVIVSMAAQWDALSPLHVGNTGQFDYWSSLIGGGFLNPPAPAS